MNQLFGLQHRNEVSSVVQFCLLCPSYGIAPYAPCFISDLTGCNYDILENLPGRNQIYCR